MCCYIASLEYFNCTQNETFQQPRALIADRINALGDTSAEISSTAWNDIEYCSNSVFCAFYTLVTFVFDRCY